MLGTRLRQARMAAGLSLEGLAGRLEHSISKQALSKYEKGLAQPSPSRMGELARALDVTASSLLAEDVIAIEWVAYRKHAKLSKARQNQLTAIAEQRLEGEFKLRRLFHLGDWHDLPGPIEVRNFHDCEYAAAALRMRWDLGDRPIDGLLELIEERGGSVVGWQEEWGFDALSGRAGRNPVLVLNTAVPPDRLRFNAAHEIGHLVMASTSDDRQDEQFAMRFAAALLVPAEAARSELGTHRRGLDLDELGLLKQRWGLSMQGWIRRARDLEITGADLYRSLNIQFRSAGWHRAEPFRYESSETPGLFRRLVLRALAENMITTEDAERFFPGMPRPTGAAGELRASLRDLARQSPEDRHRVLREVAVAVDPSETDVWDELLGDEIEWAAELSLTDETPTRGEVWLVRLPRAVGAELQRDRPAVVVSSPAFDSLAVRIVVPLMTWRDEFAGRFNKFLIPASDQNGLRADSAADFLQVRSVSTERLMRRVGVMEADEVEEIVAGIVIAVDYRP